MERLSDPGTNVIYICIHNNNLSSINIKNMFTITAVRRLVVIDSQTERVEGIISLRDVFNFLLN